MESGESAKPTNVLDSGSHCAPSAHWHEENPFADRAIYVPADRLARILGGEATLRRWLRAGNAIDAYVLMGCGNSPASVGVRYGSAPDAYLSPFNSDHESVARLVETSGFRPSRPTP